MSRDEIGQPDRSVNVGCKLTRGVVCAGRVLWLVPAPSTRDEAAREEQADTDEEQEMMTMSVSSQGGFPSLCCTVFAGPQQGHKKTKTRRRRNSRSRSALHVSSEH
jgi:hypothetical protein